MDGQEPPSRAKFVIARLDEATSGWRYLAHVEGDDRIDALDQWALEQGGFDSLEPGVYGSRRENGDDAWYRRVRPAAGGPPESAGNYGGRAVGRLGSIARD